MRTAGERSTSTQHSSATFFGRSGSGGFFGASADTDVSADASSADASSADASISRVASPMVQRQLQPAASQSVAGIDRKSTRLNPVTNAHLVCRLLLEKKNKKNNHHPEV